MHTGVWVKRVKSKVPLLRTNLVPRISLLLFLFAIKEGKKRDPGKEVGFVPLVSSMYPHSHSAAHDQGPWCENKDSRRYKVQTFVISSNSCNTASSSSWVKLPLRSLSIFCRKKIKVFVNIWLKTAEIKAFQLISLTLWYSIPSLVSSIILSTSSMDIIWDKKKKKLTWPSTCKFWHVLILVIEFKTVDIASLSHWINVKAKEKITFLILHSYLMHFLQSFISLLQSISHLKLNLSKLNILYLLYNDHSLSLTWIFYFVKGQVQRERKVFL